MLVNAGPLVRETNPHKQFADEISTPFERGYIKGQEEIRKKWKVEEIIYDIQNYQQKWNQHVLRIPEK